MKYIATPENRVLYECFMKKIQWKFLFFAKGFFSKPYVLYTYMIFDVYTWCVGIYIYLVRLELYP